ncbi:MAG: hypothetical protein QM831_39330 [Kofleriaceae bacterium]
MPLIALLAVAVIALFAYAARVRVDDTEITNEAIARSLGRLVRDGAVTVESGFVQITAKDDHKLRSPLEERTLSAVRTSGTIKVDRLFTAVRETRL